MSESRCKYGDKCKFLHTEAGGQPKKKSKKVGAQGSVASLKDFSIGLCVPRLSSGKFILREDGKLGSNHTGKFSKTTMRPVKIREKKGQSQGIIHKCEPQERNPWTPKFDERTQDESKKRSVAPAETPGNWQRMFINSKKGVQKIRSTLLPKLGGAGTLVDKTGRKTFRDRLWSFYAHVKLEGPEVKRVGDSQEIEISKNSGDSGWRGPDE